MTIVRASRLAACACAWLAVLLLVLLAAAAPYQARAQTASKQYSTRPALSYTFDSDPHSTYLGSRKQSDGSSFQWSQGAGPHTGVIAMDGVVDYADMNYLFDDAGTNFTATALGGEMSFEVWAAWEALDGWSRIFDFAGPGGIAADNLMIANLGSSNTISYQTYNGSLSTAINYNNGVNVYNWQYLVGTVAINPTGTTAATSGILTLYIGGVPVYTTTGCLPNVMLRPSSWIGRSNWWSLGDQNFRGLIDDLLIYNYSLSAEAVAAHYLVPRVALFELTFSVDPRINMNMVNNAGVTYGWQLMDLSDSPALQAAHQGMLVLSGNQYVDVTTNNGLSGVGTDLPVIGDAGWASVDNTTTGWTFETTVKFTAITPNACVFDFFVAGAQPANRIALCFSQTGTSVLITVSNSNVNSGTAVAMDVVTSVQTGVWYHILINVQPLDIGSLVARYEAFVGGTYSNSISNGVWLSRPPSTTRTSYIGRSYAGSYISAEIDSIRVYDYALSASLARALYRAVSGLTSTAVTPLYTTGPTVAYTFDTDVPYALVNGGTSLSWTNIVDTHAGVTWLLAANSQWVNLLTLPDRNMNVFPGYIGGRSISFEFWIKWNAFTSWCRVIDLSAVAFGTAAYVDNIFIATLATSGLSAAATMVFAVDGGSAGATDSRITIPNAVFTNTWYHLVATVKANTSADPTSPTSALLSIYLNGALAGSGPTTVPPYANRPDSWMGRSRYNDGYLDAYIDSFFYYDYALEAEQALAHSQVVRPPVFELTFSSAPITQPLMNTTSSYNYAWWAVDSASSAQGQVNHPGLLSLTAASQQYVDLTAASGANTVGTIAPVLASLENSNQIGQTYEWLPSQVWQRFGMTFEFSFKYNAASGANAKLFSCGATSVYDLIEVGFASGSSRDLLFTVQNTDVSRSFSTTLWSALIATRWYHVAVVLRPYNAQYGASINVYIDGQLVRQQRGALFPYATPRSQCVLGRAATGVSDTYLDGLVDVLRVYDYAVNSTEVATLFAAINPQVDPSFPPIVVPVASSTGAAGGESSGAAGGGSSGGSSGLNPAADSSSSSGLSGGAVAGIVIACIVGVLVLAVLFVWYLRSSKGSSTGGGAKASERQPHMELSEVSEARADHEHEQESA